jgi:hypothetical protein
MSVYKNANMTSSVKRKNNKKWKYFLLFYMRWARDWYYF